MLEFVQLIEAMECYARERICDIRKYVWSISQENERHVLSLLCFSGVTRKIGVGYKMDKIGFSITSFIFSSITDDESGKKKSCIVL